MTELEEQIEQAELDDRIAMVLEQPNGYSVLFFDERGGALHAEPAYLKLFQAVKNANEEDMADAEEELRDTDYLIADIIYPGVYSISEVIWYERDVPYTSLSGYNFRVDNILTTDLPIR